MPNLVYLTLSVMEISRVSQSLKSRSRDQATPLLTQIYIFCLVPPGSIYVPNLVSSFTRSGDMKRVPKFKK